MKELPSFLETSKSAMRTEEILPIESKATKQFSLLRSRWTMGNNFAASTRENTKRKREEKIDKMKEDRRL